MNENIWSRPRTTHGWIIKPQYQCSFLHFCNQCFKYYFEPYFGLSIGTKYFCTDLFRCTILKLLLIYIYQVILQHLITRIWIQILKIPQLNYMFSVSLICKSIFMSIGCYLSSDSQTHLLCIILNYKNLNLNNCW